jgi:polyhydroxyalkanoate synthesis regulator phasin
VNKKIVGYMVEYGFTPIELAEDVSTRIAQGWEPVGGVVCHTFESSTNSHQTGSHTQNTTRYFQALVKHQYFEEESKQINEDLISKLNLIRNEILEIKDSARERECVTIASDLEELERKVFDLKNGISHFVAKRLTVLGLRNN